MPGVEEHPSNLKGKNVISFIFWNNFLSGADFMVDVFSGVKKRKEGGVRALSAYRDRYDIGRMCMLASPGLLIIIAVDYELRAYEEENRVKTYHI